MVDAFVFQIDWTIVASVIGVLAFSVVAFPYAKRDRE